ncbi:hypothetical protein FRACA_90003 [Frankia canadensis]|uniref:Uncharacterized protein n=1 Tax=Frankia canadensis TaxID=1836972 RepID=A0A2I2L248_9ACTN|nr:hypothetical protein FRACA_90003 [Frankia canadensis]SOU59290.1 hypothetical protein FRACA_90003 [Frankia canadensis]
MSYHLATDRIVKAEQYAKAGIT